MIAAAHAQPPVDSVKALVLAAAVHLAALLMLVLNFNWSSSVAPAQVNVINVDLPEWLTGPAPQFMYVWAPGW